MNREQEIRDALHRLGTALGGCEFAQGPGGNVSVKSDSAELWVKASGRRLSEVASPTGHSRLPLALGILALDGDEQAAERLFAVSPRPSIETYLHVLGPRVVAHTHSLGSLLCGCSQSARVFGELPLCPSVPVIAVPYAPPGRDLAVLVRDRLPGQAECVMLLRSHGLLVYADTAERAIELTLAFEAAVDWRRKGQGRLAALMERYSSAPMETLPSGRLALPLPLRRYPSEVLAGQVLFPDAAVYASVFSVSGGNLREAATKSRLSRAHMLVSPGGERLLLAPNQGQLAHAIELAATHDFVLDELQSDAHFLPAEASEVIVGMPAEQYRMTLGAVPC